MSVIIKGMSMPKSCSDCLLNYDQCACSVTGTRWYSDTMVLLGFNCDEERLQNCPLVKLPEHHGRLIDVDAACDDFDTVNPKYQYWIDWAKRSLRAQPILIGAE